MPLFKSFKAPKATISMNVNKENPNLGETIEGTVTVVSQEEFDADEVRVELLAYERLKPGGGMVRDAQETPETRLYSQPNQNAQTMSTMECVMYRGQTKLSQQLRMTNGFNQQFPFKITVPANLGSTFQGMRHDGRWLQRVWLMKAVLAVGGRPDVETRKDICVSTPTPIQAASATVVTAAAVAPTVQGGQTIEIPTAYVEITATPPPRQVITSCPRCGASINPSQEDLIVTCRYCGFTISLATQEEIKTHSILENHLFTQQAVEAAKGYMDKGIFRSGVARDAQIINVKLKYLPFWSFPVATQTAYAGVTGEGFAGEMNQMEATLTDKSASKLSKFGRIMKAGASAYLKSQQKDRKPRTVSLSFTSSYVWPILARKSTISEVNYYDVPATKKIPFDTGKIPSDAEFLNTEFRAEEAKMKVKAEVEARERLLASGKVDTRQSCNSSVSVGDGELVHVPVWFVQYSLKGENYVVLVDGTEGKILGGGRPLVHT